MTGNEIAAQLALEWCKQHPGWVRVCDLPRGYDDSYCKKGYIVNDLGPKGKFVGVRQIHSRRYGWAWKNGLMMVIKPIDG